MISEEEVIKAVKLYSHDIRGFFLRRGVGLSDCDDRLQEVFMVLWRRREDAHPENVRSFLFSIARNITSAYWRKKMRTSELHDALRQVQERDSVQTEPSIDLSSLDELLETLAPRQKEVIRMVYGEKMTFVATAQQLGISADATRTHHNRALQKLRDQLGGI